MRPTDLPQIRTLPLFESMAEANFEQLMQAADPQLFPAQLELIREGEPADFLFVVIEGCVELYARWNRHETVMEMVRPRGTFILAAVLKDAVYLKSGRTSQRSRLLMIPAEDVREALRNDVAFACAVIEELAGCYREVVKQQKDLKLRTAVERLANSLLALDSEQGGKGCVELPYDKRTLASLLGMTPENLSRAFNTLKPYGVGVDGARIRLNDMASLERLAKPTPLIDDARV
jgi:CRP/FNR family transcriptional activator FtrB